MKVRLSIAVWVSGLSQRTKPKIMVGFVSPVPFKSKDVKAFVMGFGEGRGDRGGWWGKCRKWHGSFLVTVMFTLPPSNFHISVVHGTETYIEPLNTSS